MNVIFFFWNLIQSVTRGFSRNLDMQEQHALEAYLSQSQSVSELEYREREWMRAGN